MEPKGCDQSPISPPLEPQSRWKLPIHRDRCAPGFNLDSGHGVKMIPRHGLGKTPWQPPVGWRLVSLLPRRHHQLTRSTDPIQMSLLGTLEFSWAETEKVGWFGCIHTPFRKLTAGSPENHSFDKENHLPNFRKLGSMLNFGGVLCGVFFWRPQEPQ